ncbi:MAG: Holliday junction branch migration protein RuvA [Alphaproteobacteria bacterium]|nr:Holliday junction branch migration protein RuvA [Alphaproteobacteria bacterium]OJV47559.1 MAG: Holliday junction DNA helicase RuvA [Alphaproteobacteria bacterium 43-37]
MIASLRGILELSGLNDVLVDVNGVGYLVHISQKARQSLSGNVGGNVSLIIQTLVREDSIDLYGFTHEDERSMFTLLLTVQGVGAKVALAILSALSLDEIAHALAIQDKNAFVRADGVGPKLGARIVMELKDKLPARSHFDVSFHKQPETVVANTDAVAVLCRLGYKRSEAESAVRLATQSLPSASMEDFIKHALNSLTQGVK